MGWVGSSGMLGSDAWMLVILVHSISASSLRAEHCVLEQLILATVTAATALPLIFFAALKLTKSLLA